MNEQPLASRSTPATAPAPENVFVVEKRAALFPLARSWKIASVVAAIMVLLAMLGVGLTYAASSAAPTYWISLVPIYGLLCVSFAWARARYEHGLHRPVVIRQVFHWLGIGVALGLDFYIRGTGEESNTAAGMNALLLLALGCYLAGVHLEWLFIVVGLLLTGALVTVTKAEQYFWLIFIVGGVAVAAMLALGWYLSKAQVPSAEKIPSHSSVPASS